jgi:hypothetical protein
MSNAELRCRSLFKGRDGAAEDELPAVENLQQRRSKLVA